jgi:wyosine [tRNA(Phe)-imidazoG37] synthetase (radical SAM superfamily)
VCIAKLGIYVKNLLSDKNFYDPDKLLENVENHLEKLDKTHFPDYLTFVANGEPTIDINLGTEIKMLKKFHNVNNL